MQVRRADARDASAVGDLVAQFFTEEGFATPAAAVRARAAAFIAEPANAAFLAVDDDGTPFGVATMTTVFGFETGWYGELEDLYVVPAARGRGAARALIDAVLDEARARGCSDVEIAVTPEGDAAHGLLDWYTKLGWEDTQRRLLEREL